jgi:hypothetical protein
LELPIAKIDLCRDILPHMLFTVRRIVCFLSLLSGVVIRSGCFLVSPLARKARTIRFSISEAVDRSQTADTGIDDSLVIQKNLILLEKLISPLAGNLTETAYEYVNFCDESFNQFLNERIASCESKSGKTALGRIRYELNVARQKKLTEADRILRGILKSGGVQEMEAQLRVHLRRAEIDMAFMVILQLNIEDAMHADARKAVEVMTHLGEIITAHQDGLVSAPVRLVRQLVRTEDSAARKQLLRQHLRAGPVAESGMQGAYATRTVRTPGSPVRPSERRVSANRPAGSVSVTALELEDTLKDLLLQVSYVWFAITKSGAELTRRVFFCFLSRSVPYLFTQTVCFTFYVLCVQMRGIGGAQEPARLDLQRRCGILRREIEEVLAERRHEVPPATGPR